MKASEYFNKYFSDAKETEVPERASKMYAEILGEYNTLKEARNVKTFDGAVAIVRELNDKWNAVLLKVDMKFGRQLLPRNFVWNQVLVDGYPDRYAKKPIS